MSGIQKRKSGHPRPNAIRFSVDPRDVPPAKAARRLHLTIAEFQAMLPELFARGFPQPDQTTGNYDLVAIDRWMDLRSSIASLAGLTESPAPRNAADVYRERAARLANGQ